MHRWFPLPTRLQFVSFMVLVALPTILPATKLRNVNLEQMTERADRVFIGRCVGNEILDDADRPLPTMRLTFSVEQTLKGDLGETVTIKVPRSPSGQGVGLAGMPAFKTGEEVLLFLYGESASGYSSPVGLGQGKFTLHKDKQGRRIAINEFGNENLFRGLSDDGRRRLGPAAIDDRGPRAILSTDLSEMILKLRP